MTDDYAVRRKEYVNEIRKSFDLPKQENQQTEKTENSSFGWLFFKVRMCLALALMLLFFLFYSYGYEIYGYQAQDIIDMISDNHYYTILKNYVTITTAQTGAD